MQNKRIRQLLSRWFYAVPITCYTAVLMILSSLIIGGGQKIHILIAAAVIGGYDVIYNSVMAVMRRRLLSTELFTLAAVIGTFALGLWVEGALGMTVFAVCRSIYAEEVAFEKGRLEFRYANAYDDKTRRELNEMEPALSPAEKSIRRASVVFPLAFFAAIVILSIIVPLIWRTAVTVWLRRAFILLAAACPSYIELCAAAETARAVDECALNGVFFKSRGALEKASKITSVVFSRIESVSVSRFEIADVIPHNIGKDELLAMACYACAFAGDEIAQALAVETGIAADPKKVDMYKVLPGLGSAVIMGGVKVAAGNEKLMDMLGIDYEKQNSPGIHIYVCAGKKYAGCIRLAEPVKPADAAAVEAIHGCGIERVALISEENDANAGVVAKKLGIDEAWSDIPRGELPVKMKNLRDMQLEGEVMAYVGSGAAEAEIMKQADIGVMLGGSRVCGEIFIDDGSYMKVPFSIARSCEMMRGIRKNLIAAGILKVVAVVLAISGFSGIWLSALLDAAAAAYILDMPKDKK